MILGDPKTAVGMTRSGRWQIPLAEVLCRRSTQQALGEAGGDDLTAEDLEVLSETRPGTLPWRRVGWPSDPFVPPDWRYDDPACTRRRASCISPSRTIVVG